MNGGNLLLAGQRFGTWEGEAKYNGWRAVIHLPSGTIFNRQGDVLSISDEFRAALKGLHALGLPSEWADCEALSRRHGIGKGTLLLLDYFDDRASYRARRAVMERSLHTLSVGRKPRPDSLYLVPSYPQAEFKKLWARLQRLNLQWGVEFYEGLVLKRADSVYPFQRFSATAESAEWIKHRFC